MPLSAPVIKTTGLLMDSSPSWYGVGPKVSAPEGLKNGP
jgi:hypothetical protein